MWGIKPNGTTGANLQQDQVIGIWKKKYAGFAPFL